MSKLRVLVEKTPEITAMEAAGKALLRDYCQAKRGRALQLAAASGLAAPHLSRMMNIESTAISLEAAMLIDTATSGELPAEALCPSRAQLLENFVTSRTRAVTAA